MKKYWALIIANRPHIFSLGKHNAPEAAETMAQEFVDKKNAENQTTHETQCQQNPGVEIPEPSVYQLAYILDESDLRVLTGEVHRPYVIAKQREAIEVAPPTRQGGQPAPQTIETENDAGEEAP